MRGSLRRGIVGLLCSDHAQPPHEIPDSPVQARLQGVVLPGIGPVPVQLIQALPYLITVAILAGFVRTARPPRALGKPYPPTR